MGCRRRHRRIDGVAADKHSRVSRRGEATKREFELVSDICPTLATLTPTQTITSLCRAAATLANPAPRLADKRNAAKCGLLAAAPAPVAVCRPTGVWPVSAKFRSCPEPHTAHRGRVGFGVFKADRRRWQDDSRRLSSILRKVTSGKWFSMLSNLTTFQCSEVVSPMSASMMDSAIP